MNKKGKSEFDSQTEIKLKVKKSDTIISYFLPDFDTIQKTQNVYIGNDKHDLKLKSYWLNDSSIVNINGNYKKIYSNRISEIILTIYQDTILNTKLDKAIFKDSLDGIFYRKCVLSGIEYSRIHSNRIYFKGEFFIPDTESTFENEFAIFYRTKKKNKIASWNYKNITSD